MVKGPRKHLKRVAAPKSWRLSKYGGVFAPRPTPGPHKIRECIPLILLLRNRLKYALTRKEAFKIAEQRLITVDKKVRTDINFPLGVMDVVQIEKTGESFRMMYDCRGRFCSHRIQEKEAEYKLCRVSALHTAPGGIPFLQTGDSRCIRYPNPAIKANDSIRLNLVTGKIDGFVKCAVGNLAMVTGGHSIGRVGEITKIEVHQGGIDLVYLKDARGTEFLTRVGFVFVIGDSDGPQISLLEDSGIKKTIEEERKERIESGVDRKKFG